MNLSKKWSVAAAALLSLALVGGGAVSANAAPGDPLNPQSNGSKGSFFLYDANTGVFADGDPTRVYTRGEALIASASSTDVNAEINPAATRPVTGSTAFTGVYRFLSDQNPAAVNGGTNTWKAFAVDSATGVNGGTVSPDFTLDAFTSGINAVIAQGGQYWYGVAYTTNNGVTTVGAVYRSINITAGSGDYTVGAVELETVVEAPADLVLESELTAANEVPASAAADSTVVGIQAGAANANKTLKAATFQNGARIELGNVTLDASGNGTVDVAGKGITVNTANKLFLYESVLRPAPSTTSDEVLAAWGSFTLTQTFQTSVSGQVTTNVTASGRFEIVAPAGLGVDLGNIRRNQTTTPKAFGQFTVFDDRDNLLGWNVNVSATDFVGPVAGKNIPASALGYAGVQAGGQQNGVSLGAAKVAGAGAFGTLVEAAAGSSTAEEGANFNADLTFKAPVDAVKGTYNSTVTLTLVSK